MINKLKKIFILNLILASGFNLNPNDIKGPEIYSYVYAKNGLKLRSNPDLKADTIVIIPYSSRVKIITTNSNFIAIDDKIGQWTYISYNNINGWVFSGYLIPDDPTKLLNFAFTKINKKNKKIYSDSSMNFSIKYLKIKSVFNNLAVITYPGTGLEPGMMSWIDSLWIFDGKSWNPFKSNTNLGYSEKINDSPNSKNISLILINNDTIPDLIITEFCCGSSYKTEIFLSEDLPNQYKMIKSINDHYLSDFNWLNLCGDNVYRFKSALDDTVIKFKFNCDLQKVIFN